MMKRGCSSCKYFDKINFICKRGYGVYTVTGLLSTSWVLNRSANCEHYKPIESDINGKV